MQTDGWAGHKVGQQTERYTERYTPQKHGSTAAVTTGNSVSAENKRGKL
jgi:hypothetical protein